MGGMWWDVGDSPTGKDCGYEGRGWGSLITYPWQPRSVRFADLLCLRLTTWNVYIRIMSKKQNQFLRHKKITAYYQKIHTCTCKCACIICSCNFCVHVVYNHLYQSVWVNISNSKNYKTTSLLLIACSENNSLWIKVIVRASCLTKPDIPL